MKHPVSALLAIPLLFSGAHFVAKLARAWILTTPVHTLATFRCGRTKRGGAPILVLLLAASLPSSVRGFESNANAEAGESTNSVEKPILAEDRQHWAFQPLDRPPLPAVVDRTWPRNAIDQFILAKIEAAGMSPLPSADRFTLIRRLTFDLTGLPPTPRAIAEFISDQSPDAYDRLVERLLASPEYGVRWGQHWLDLARFAETDGFEHDHVRPDAWRYRDWVIDALNLDLPLDEFLRMQLAGDELQPDELSAAIPTGFLLCGPDMPDINRQDERRHTFLNEMTATVSSVMLGLQMGCAQCHDHKYDPISQLDFYRLRAFFEHDDLFKKHPVPTTEQRAVQRQFQAKRQTPPPMPMGRVMREPDAVVKPSHLRIRGDFQRIGPRVFPEFPRIVNATDSKVPQPKPNAVSSGRRTALAAWLTQPDHRLTTRVLVNRIWQFHFGQGLCRSPSDFGLMGEAPTHPQLLDWLATELPRQGWSLKRMHRLLLTSATYRQASRPTSRDWTPQQTAAARESWQLAKRQDPDNELLARMPRHRLEGEAIRDAILAAADDLNQRRGGPGIRPPLPKELLVTLLKNQWPVTADVQD
ncbi:MAG: DUF1549 and DUF1553 domain-containing protein, partial [Planctomycetota bacterium]|nr:DUF1549 and DUF1553 domain-containing protein [Planctomycetota bacterium]